MGLKKCNKIALVLDHPSARDFGLTPDKIEFLVEEGADTVLTVIDSGILWKPSYYDRVCRAGLKSVLTRFKSTAFTLSPRESSRCNL
jgi:hypothetical protein